MRYFLKINILIWANLLGEINAYSQINDNDSKLIKQSFIALNDSILLSNDSLNEFKPIYELSKEKSFVAIGEATHGTDEIRKIQLILAKGFVLNSEFKVIALGETPLLESYPLFDFVVNGNGDLKKISNMFQFDIYNLLDWLKKYNSNKPFKQKIWLLGGSVDTYDKIIDFVSVHCKANAYDDHTHNLIEKIGSIFSNNVNSAKANVDSLNIYKSELISILNAKKGVTDSLDFKLGCMVRGLNILTDILINKNNSLAAFQQRDRIIFDNLEWMFNSKGKTAIILSHNLHTNKKTLEKDYYNHSSKPFGEYLGEKFNQNYLSIGTEIKQGFFTGTPNKEKILEDSQKMGSIIGSIVPNNFGFLLFDDQLRNTFNTKGLKITKGTSKSFLVESNGILGNAFDGIIYIKSSSPYTFYNNEDLCSLFLNLSNELISNIIMRKKLIISANYEINKNLPEGAITYSVYLNDSNKKVIKHYIKSLAESSQDIIFEIPEQTKYVSVNLVLRKIDYFKLSSLSLNNQSQNFKKLSFHDWNNIGYKFEKQKSNILITK